jgi:divalent metal cation (Fe/Co/Zn/Cd) transporter
VIGIERIRARTVGPTHFIEAAVNVPRTYPIDRVEDIKRAAQTAVKSALADSDLTFTAVPTVLDNETVRERIMVIARNAGLAIHHVTVHDLDNKLAVSIDLEVEADMALERAHDITHRLEDAIKAEFGDHIEIDIHIEPLEPELPHGGDATAERIDTVQRALTRIAASLGTMHDVHNVRVRDTGAGQIVNFHCRTRPDLRVSQVHAAVDDIERALRRDFADVKRVIGHAEPDR